MNKLKLKMRQEKQENALFSNTVELV